MPWPDQPLDFTLRLLICFLQQKQTDTSFWMNPFCLFQKNPSNVDLVSKTWLLQTSFTSEIHLKEDQNQSWRKQNAPVTPTSKSKNQTLELKTTKLYLNILNYKNICFEVIHGFLYSWKLTSIESLDASICQVFAMFYCQSAMPTTKVNIPIIAWILHAASRVICSTSWAPNLKKDHLEIVVPNGFLTSRVITK